MSITGADLIAQVPPQWASTMRPFLQRAVEFDLREPLVAYFLRTHAAFIGMKLRTKEDKAGTKFLMDLLTFLEASKKQLGAELDDVDGRTVLTKAALMLFAKADDDERSGKSSMVIVRLFFTSAVLFEATVQFTDRGTMDSIATEKSKYAKYIALRMKKALDAGVPYVSPNSTTTTPQHPMGGGSGDGEEGNNGEEHEGMNAFTSPPPGGAAALPQRQQQPPSVISQAPQYQPQEPLSYQYPSPSNDNLFSTSPPPAYAPPTHLQPQRLAQPTPSGFNNNSNSGGGCAATTEYASPNIVVTGYKPSTETMIDAQKRARQAVSALQFYDYKTAKAELVAALRMLDGH